MASVSSGSVYVIVNVKSGTVMDLSLGDSKTVTGWAYNGGSNQKWTLNWAGNGWTFQNQNTGTYLGIQGSPANLTPVVAVENAMIWDIWRDDVDSNTFRIYAPNTLLNLDLYNYGSATSGDPITLYKAWNGLHQTWAFHQG